MSGVTFVIPRTHYDSYQDLYRLIALSGFAACHPDEVDAASDQTYIVTVYNGETMNGWPGARARIVLWDFEWRTQPLPPIPGVAEVWYADAWQARVAGGRYVAMGGHAGLCTGDGPKSFVSYDVAFLGYVVARRQVVLTQLQQRGAKMPPASMWGKARDAVLRASRAYLHIHQHEHAPGIPPLRLVVAAAYRLPFVSEAFADSGIFGAATLLASDYAHLAEFVHLWTRQDSPALRDRGHALYRLLCEDLTFRKSVEEAL